MAVLKDLAITLLSFLTALVVIVVGVIYFMYMMVAMMGCGHADWSVTKYMM